MGFILEFICSRSSPRCVFIFHEMKKIVFVSAFCILLFGTFSVDEHIMVIHGFRLKASESLMQENIKDGLTTTILTYVECCGKFIAGRKRDNEGKDEWEGKKTWKTTFFILQSIVDSAHGNNNYFIHDKNGNSSVTGRWLPPPAYPPPKSASRWWPHERKVNSSQIPTLRRWSEMLLRNANWKREYKSSFTVWSARWLNHHCYGSCWRCKQRRIFGAQQ